MVQRLSLVIQSSTRSELDHSEQCKGYVGAFGIVQGLSLVIRNTRAGLDHSELYKG